MEEKRIERAHPDTVTTSKSTERLTQVFQVFRENLCAIEKSEREREKSEREPIEATASSNGGGGKVIINVTIVKIERCFSYIHP